MVPYVRLSFYKHWKDGIHYFGEKTDINEQTPLSKIKEISIVDKSFYANPKVHQYAMDMTTKEVYQAVEGMYHNLSIWAA